MNYYTALYQNSNSHLLSLYVFNWSCGRNLLKYQLDSSCVIMSSILVTTVFYKAVISLFRALRVKKLNKWQNHNVLTSKYVLKALLQVSHNWEKLKKTVTIKNFQVLIFFTSYSSIFRTIFVGILCAVSNHRFEPVKINFHLTINA